ncbi:MAG: phosphate signaling complex protein PhoU [Acetobacteraceae bacterium]|nr:phosphate signaling complex protein PhoU [Acetobacteraceae bacterium]
MSIRKDFDIKLQALGESILVMGRKAETMLETALNALADRSPELADRAIAMDDEVDALNLDIERRCLELIALQQPMARDLRIIAAASRIITDVERIGDLTVDVAKVAKALAPRPLFKPLEDIPRLCRLVQRMLRDSLEGYASRDLSLIQRMIQDDEAVDHLYHSLYDELVGFMEKDPGLVRQAVHLLMISHYLERIADHITNIGEWTIYMVTGERRDLNL